LLKKYFRETGNVLASEATTPARYGFNDPVAFAASDRSGETDCPRPWFEKPVRGVGSLRATETIILASRKILKNYLSGLPSKGSLRERTYVARFQTKGGKAAEPPSQSPATF
jgi:hypothetical protein